MKVTLEMPKGDVEKLRAMLAVIMHQPKDYDSVRWEAVEQLDRQIC
jgi:hypothetical protein